MASNEESSSRQWFAIAAIGRDRPGIVADLSECVYECGCNLEDASMTMLGSEFATLMLISGLGDELERRVSDAMKHLEWERRLSIFVRPLESAPDPPHGPGARTFELVAEGIDKAGIVAGVARSLADHGVLIADLRGAIAPIPQSGTPLYRLSIRMSVPATVDLADLQSELGRIAEHLDVEISLNEGA